MPSPSENTPAVRAWRALLNAHAAAIRRINQDLVGRGALPLEWYDALLELYRAPRRQLRLRDLGERVVLTRSGMSRLISRLEEAGLVRRDDDGSDARGVLAVLTREGEKAFRATWSVYAEGIEAHFGCHFSEAECATLEKLLGRV